MNRPEYNDSPLPIDQALYDRMRKHGEFPAEPAIAFSSALINRGMQESTNYFPNTSPTYLFVILLLYFPSSSIKTTVRAQTISRCVHFLLPFFFCVGQALMSVSTSQNIQSTNWQTLRFKPPPPKSPIGWRVEFRSMEAQMTDFENAAFSVFIVLLSRAIMSMNLNFYIPISKVRYPPHPHTRSKVGTPPGQASDVGLPGTHRSTRTCVAHNSAMPSTTPSSSSAAKYSRPRRRALRLARRLQTMTSDYHVLARLYLLARRRASPRYHPTERARTAATAAAPSTA